MLIRFGAEELKPKWPACVVCIGTFDGVYRGHQEVIRTFVNDRADVYSSQGATFSRHRLLIFGSRTGNA